MAEAERALGRIKASRRPVTAVEIRCRTAGHLVATVHPVGTARWLLWCRPGRSADTEAGGFERDHERVLILLSPVRQVGGYTRFGETVPLTCRCGGWEIDHEVSNQLAAEVCAWRADGPQRRTRVVLLG